MGGIEEVIHILIEKFNPYAIIQYGSSLTKEDPHDVDLLVLNENQDFFARHNQFDIHVMSDKTQEEEVGHLDYVLSDQMKTSKLIWGDTTKYQEIISKLERKPTKKDARYQKKRAKECFEHSNYHSDKLYTEQSTVRLFEALNSLSFSYVYLIAEEKYAQGETFDYYETAKNPKTKLEKEFSKTFLMKKQFEKGNINIFEGHRLLIYSSDKFKKLLQN